MSTLAKLLLILPLVSSTSTSTKSGDQFDEEVLIRSLPTGDVLASFSFTTRSATPVDGPRRHFDLLPRFVGEIVDENGVFELDIALSRGVWRSRFWGYPPRPTATGARVSAFFKPGIDDKFVRSSSHCHLKIHFSSGKQQSSHSLIWGAWKRLIHSEGCVFQTLTTHTVAVYSWFFSLRSGE